MCGTKITKNTVDRIYKCRFNSSYDCKQIKSLILKLKTRTSKFHVHMHFICVFALCTWCLQKLIFSSHYTCHLLTFCKLKFMVKKDFFIKKCIITLRAIWTIINLNRFLISVQLPVHWIHSQTCIISLPLTTQDITHTYLNCFNSCIRK